MYYQTQPAKGPWEYRAPFPSQPGTHSMQIDRWQQKSPWAGRQGPEDDKRTRNLFPSNSRQPRSVQDVREYRPFHVHFHNPAFAVPHSGDRDDRL